MLYIFFGVIGSGKTYSADRLMENTGGIVCDFKDPLIDMCYAITKSPLNYSDFKQCVVGSNGLEQSKSLLEIQPNLLTGRQLLQRLGTDAIRKYDPEFFVRAFTNTVRKHRHEPVIVNCDMRFPNELRAILELDVVKQFVFCNYKSELYDDKCTHVSEQMNQSFLKMVRSGTHVFDISKNIVIPESLMRSFYETYTGANSK